MDEEEVAKVSIIDQKGAVKASDFLTQQSKKHSVSQVVANLEQDNLLILDNPYDDEVIQNEETEIQNEDDFGQEQSPIPVDIFYSQ